MDGEVFEGVVVDSPAEKTAEEKAKEGRNLRWGCLTLFAILAGLATVVVGVILLYQYSAQLTWMIAAAVVAVLALLRARHVGRSGLLFAAAVVIMLAGGEANFFVPAQVVGTIVLLVGIGLAIPGLYLQEARVTRRGMVLSIAWGVTVGVGLFGVVCWTIGTNPGFIRHYGEKVTVSPGGCVWNMNLTDADKSDVFCSSSSWRRADGTQVQHGGLTGRPGELIRGPLTHVNSAPAYAFHTIAVTPGISVDPGPIAQLGLVSGWLTYAPLLALLLTFAYRRRRSKA